MKGYTQIALGAAAGAFVASRMSRSALLVTLGLAYALWKKQDQGRDSTDEAAAEHLNSRELDCGTESNFQQIQGGQQIHSKSQFTGLPESAGAFLSFDSSAEVIRENQPQPEAPEEISTSQQHEPEWLTRETAPAAQMTSALLLSPPDTFSSADDEPVIQAYEQPVEPVEVPVYADTAWNDLRAALSPIPGAGSVEEMPDPMEIEPPLFSINNEPQIQAMSFCLPSEPMVEPSLGEDDDQLNEIQLTWMSEVEPPLSLLPSPISEAPAVPQPLGVSAPVIVAKQITQQLFDDAEDPESNFEAPMIIPRDLQARKSFFDWLRG